MKKIFKFNVIFSIIGFGLLVVGTYLILSASQIGMVDALEKTPDGEARLEIIAATKILISNISANIKRGTIKVERVGILTQSTKSAIN